MKTFAKRTARTLPTQPQKTGEAKLAAPVALTPDQIEMIAAGATERPVSNSEPGTLSGAQPAGKGTNTSMEK